MDSIKMVTQKDKGKALLKTYNKEEKRQPLLPVLLSPQAKLKRKLQELESENKRMKMTIETLKGKQESSPVQKEAPQREAPQREEPQRETPQREVPTPELQAEEKEFIPKHLLAKINRCCPQKAVNDLLHGIYTTSYMASHCLTGSETKQGFPVDAVFTITQTIMAIFPAYSAAQVRSFIRQKLNNASKIEARRVKQRNQKSGSHVMES